MTDNTDSNSDSSETDPEAIVTNEDRDEALGTIESWDGPDVVLEVPDDADAPTREELRELQPIENVDVFGLRARADPTLLNDEYGPIPDDLIRKSLENLGKAVRNGTITQSDARVMWVGAHPDRETGITDSLALDASDVTTAFERIRQVARDARDKRRQASKKRRKAMAEERRRRAQRARGSRQNGHRRRH